MDQLWLFVPDYGGKLKKFTDPKTDNELLWNSQVEWLITGKESAYADMWLRSIAICKKLIRKEMNLKKFSLPREEINDKAVDAVEYVFRQYDRHFAFIIKKFAGALYFGVRHALYYQTLGERCFSEAIKIMNEKNCRSLEEAFLLAKDKLNREQKKKKKKKASKDYQLELFTYV